MKQAYVYSHTVRGPAPKMRGDKVVVVTVFRWWHFLAVTRPTGQIGWSLHFLVFCNGIMSDFMHQSSQGVFAIGYNHGFYLELCPREEVYRLWLWPTIHFEKGPIR